jgi:single-stranded DNA-binding protein
MTTPSTPMVALATSPTRPGITGNQSDLIFLAGRLQYRTWEAKDGQKRRTAEIVATELIALDRKPEPQLQVVNSAAEDENLPF